MKITSIFIDRDSIRDSIKRSLPLSFYDVSSKFIPLLIRRKNKFNVLLIIQFRPLKRRALEFHPLSRLA